MSWGEIIVNWNNISICKLISIADQSLFDCFVSCQHYNLLKSEVDGEN